MLLSSGCRATVESLSSVHSSSTVTDLPWWMLIARAVSAEFKAFSFPVIKVIPLFRYSVITCDVLQRPKISSLTPRHLAINTGNVNTQLKI